MPKATRLMDLGSGHGCHFPPSPAIAASPNVFTNSIPAVRQGDAYAPHPCPVCPQPPHPRSLAQGSSTVFINGKPASRKVAALNMLGSEVALRTVELVQLGRIPTLHRGYHAQTKFEIMPQAFEEMDDITTY